MFICYKLKSSYKELHKGYQELEDKYSQIVNLLLDATEDISQVELILTAKCFNRKEVIDLISECDFQLVLNNDKVSRVVTDFWKGPYETEFFMNNCYAYAQIRELFIDSKKFFGYKPAGEYAFSIDRLWRQKSQKKIFEENEKSKNKARYANNFQFEQWDKCLSTKYFIETLFIIIGSTIVSINSSYTLELSIEAQPSATTVLGIVSQLESDGLSESTRQSLINQVEPIANEAEERLEKFFRSIDINIMINWILATYILKLISEYIFVKIRSKSFSFMATDIVLNIIYFVTLTWMTCLLHFDYYQHAPRSDEYYYVRVYLYVTTHMQDFGTQVCFAILLMVHTIRVLNILRASQTFGPMIEIIFSMIIELFKFMVIFQCIILIFTSSMRILFFTLPEFSSRTETYVTLYSASLSNFDFSIFQSELMSVNKLYGYCFMGLFLLVSAIALLNFLIAVISHVYEKLNQIKVGLYLKSLIGIRQVMQHDDRYSCLVSSVPPLNIVPFIMTPAVLWMQSKKLNYCILHYEYLVVAIVGMTLYILFAIICIPFAYVLIIGTLLKTMCGKKRSEKSKCTQITDLFLFIIFGFIMLICRTICDFGLFICDLYNTNLIKCTDIESTSVNTRSTITGEVDKNFYLLFLLFLKQYPSKKVHSKKLIADLRSLLDIHQHLRTIIFSGKEANQLFKSNKTLWDRKNLDKTLKKEDNDDLMEFKAKIFRSYSSQEILEQFNILKKIINKCSIPNMRKEGRRGFESNKENFARDSWGSIGDDVHPSPTLKRTKTQKERLIKTHFQTIFYIPEFLDITSELQNKEVFQELIYANTHECSSISKFTKAGKHRSNLLEKDSLKINLELLREQYHTKVPSLQDLKLLEVTRNYECLARFCESN